MHEADLTRDDIVYQIGLPPRRIDVITSITGVGFDEAWRTRSEVDWNGKRVGVLGFEALLTNERASGRPKGLADVDELSRRPRSRP